MDPVWLCTAIVDPVSRNKFDKWGVMPALVFVGGRYFSISVCLFLFAFVLCRSNLILKVELPLDWLRELHEPLLSFKPAINFIAPWFGLAPNPLQYFLVLDWAAKIFAV